MKMLTNCISLQKLSTDKRTTAFLADLVLIKISDELVTNFVKLTVKNFFKQLTAIQIILDKH